jgi:ribosomal protein S18 acetylase RimI-like enzyme
MQEQGVDCACLETEVHNVSALALYEQLGFVRTKLLPRYYLNNSDAYRLKFFFTPHFMTVQQDRYIAEQKALAEEQEMAERTAGASEEEAAGA